MTALDKVDADITQARATVKVALAFINSITEESLAADAYDRVKLAKEWARIRRISTQVHRDLLRLEIHCLRKIAQLGPVTIIERTQRGAAEYFRDKTDAEIESLITDHGEKVTPAGLMRRALNTAEFKAGYEHVSSGKYRAQVKEYSEEETAAAVKKYAIDTKAALASILSDYEETGAEFSVYDLASEVFTNIGYDERNAGWGAEAAMADLCRKAVTEGSDELISGTRAPKFVTCLYRGEGGIERGHYIRVPFHAATIDQLQDMVHLRMQQFHSAKKTYEELDSLLEELDAQTSDNDGSSKPTLGELAMRLSASQRRNDAADPEQILHGRRRRAS